jgi:hypothetical protein
MLLVMYVDTGLQDDRSASSSSNYGNPLGVDRPDTDQFEMLRVVIRPSLPLMLRVLFSEMAVRSTSITLDMMGPMFGVRTRHCTGGRGRANFADSHPCPYL